MVGARMECQGRVRTYDVASLPGLQRITGILARCSTPVQERRLGGQRLQWDLLQQMEITGRITPGTLSSWLWARIKYSMWKDASGGLSSSTWIPSSYVLMVIEINSHFFYKRSWCPSSWPPRSIGWAGGSPAARIGERYDLFQTRSIEAQYCLKDRSSNIMHQAVFLAGSAMSSADWLYVQHATIMDSWSQIWKAEIGCHTSAQVWQEELKN